MGKPEYAVPETVGASQSTAFRAASHPTREEASETDRLIERILRVGAAVAIAGAAVQVASQLLNYFVFDLDVWTLNVDADDNVFAWASSAAQFAAAFTCLLLAIAGWWSPRRLGVLALILALFSLDDIARFHERSSDSVRSLFDIDLAYGRLIWPFLFFPLLGAAFVLLWRFAEEAPSRAGSFVRIGLVMLVLAVIAEGISTAFHVGEAEEGTLQDILQVAVEESLELSAWVLISSALAATLFWAASRRDGHTA
jgi:hypothetical protein